MARTELLQIGEVGRRVGLSLRTIRYYEEMGLVDPSDRTTGGFRLYTEEDVARLATLKGMKPLGLTLEEIKELMALFDSSADLAGQSAGDLSALVRGLAQYSELAGQRLERLERYLAEGNRLGARIESRLEECQAMLERIRPDAAIGLPRTTSSESEAAARQP